MRQFDCLNSVFALKNERTPRFQFALGNSAVQAWTNILNELDKNEQIPALLHTVKQAGEYPRNSRLRQAELVWLISKTEIIDAEWQPIYQASSTPLSGKRPKVNDLAAAVQQLWALGKQSNERIPVLDFVASIAHHRADQYPQFAIDLEDWIAETAHDYWDTAPYAIDDNLLAQQTRQPRPAYLQLLLDPDPANENCLPKDYRFNLQMLWWYDGQSPRRLNDDNKRPLRAGEIMQEVNTLLDQLDRDNTYKTLTIEYFLPSYEIGHLLTHEHQGHHVHDLDQWEFAKGERIKGKRGQEYPIVLRLLDRRNYKQVDVKKWHRRWELLHAQPLQLCDESLLWLEEGQKFTAQTLYHDLENNEPLTCIGTLFAPATVDDLLDILEALLWSGTPVALIPRVHPGHNPLDFRKRFEPKQLCNLPQVIKKLRMQAIADPAHVGNHVTLLWDDPSHIPPAFPFATP